MAEIKRGTVMLLFTAGDPEISGALADGIMKGRGARRAAPIRDERKVLTPEQVEVVKAEINLQKAAGLLRVAMHREPVDYAGKCFDAEMEYGESLYYPSGLRRVIEKLQVAYAVIALAIERMSKHSKV